MKRKSHQPPPPTPHDAVEEHDERGGDRAFPIVGVGASAGGLEAFTQLLEALPIDTGMAFVLVQHLDPDHESALAQILARTTSLPVNEITNDETVRPNHVYIIPRDTHLTIVKGVLMLHPRERSRVAQRPIDSFFESLAQDQRERAVGVVLSGTANDGTMGLEAIKAEGGITFAQDASAKYDSMPRSASAAGCVDLVLSPAAIATELARIAKHPCVAGQPLAFSPAAQGADAEDAAQESDDAALPPGSKGGTEPDVGARSKIPLDGYKRVLLLLRNHSGVDFSLYKSTTILRRMTRRLVLNRQASLSDYARFLVGNAKELDALYADVLISVTSFFRNPQTFDVLENKILPELLKQPGDDPLRCWVLGCSSGQEAYSIAIAFLEAAERAPRMRKLQIFATDLNDQLLEKARHGLYPQTLTLDIAPERLRRFFVEENGGHRVCKTLRDMVVFARHNLIADPPFSRMDLISCRNLLIYLEQSLQRRAIPTFHYALKPDGFLLLGASESVSGFNELFEPVDNKNKIYAKKAAPTVAFHLPVRKVTGEWTPPRPQLPVHPPVETERSEGVRIEPSAEREANRITFNHFAPPAVLVNAELQILQFRGPTGAFLEPPTGKASFDVLRMARDGLALPLRSAIAQARKENKTARKSDIRLTHDGKTRTVSLEVIPLKNLREPCFLIVFDEAGREPARVGSPEALGARANPPRANEEPNRIVELETALAEAREDLQSMQEQHEAASEELQSANEEVQSANEEMQSVNEELQSSTEELESTNEELTTVNEEMSNRNVELSRLNSDLTNLQNSTKLAIILLGRDLTVRHFTPQAEKQFALQAADLGRPIRHIQHNLAFGDPTERGVDLEALGTEVISNVREQEHQVHDKSGRSLSLSIRPYITLENKVDGVVLVLVDITDRRRAEEAAAHLAAIVAASDDAIISKDLGGVIQSWNRGAERLFGYTAEEAIGKSSLRLIPPDRADEEPGILARVGRGETVEHYETVRQRKDGSLVDISLTVSPMRDPAGRVIGSAKVARDITDRKRTEEALRQRAVELAEGEKRKNEFLAMLGHELRNPLAALVHGLELMGNVADDKERSEQLRMVMVRQCERIGVLLDQLLDIARVITGKVALSKKRMDLADAIRAGVESVKPHLDAQKHTLTLSLPSDRVLVMGDAVRLTQVVENLLTNAIKYTAEGGRIDVALEADDDHARFVVRDTGVGLSADFVPHVFEVFTQAHRSLDRAQGGLGLGLPLVSRLVEMHGGQVSASSAGLNMGSEFVVTLPRLPEALSKARGPIEPAPTKSLTKIRSRRILVVDDEEEASQFLADLLELGGHISRAVSDGPTALAAVGTFDPEVVILDLGLPGMDGYEVARRMRNEYPDKKILLIAVTGYQKDAVRLKEAGFDHHLVKPANLKALSAIIENWDAGEPR